MTKRLTEDDVIDFGIYKGWFLRNVPSKYLLWCYRKNRATPSVRQYIRANYNKLLDDEKKEKPKHPSTDNRQDNQTSKK